MAKVKVYLRVAKSRSGARTPYKVDASQTPNHKPLTVGSGMYQSYLPTVSFAVVLNLPDDAFKRAEEVIAEIDVPTGLPVIAADVEQG